MSLHLIVRIHNVRYIWIALFTSNHEDSHLCWKIKKLQQLHCLQRIAQRRYIYNSAGRTFLTRVVYPKVRHLATNTFSL